MDGPGQSFPSTKARRRIAFSTWWTLPNDNGQNSSTTSKASSTALSPLLPPVMSPTSHWQGVPSTLTKERGSGGTLIPAHVLRRAAAKGSFRVSETDFSAGCRVLELDNMVTGPLSVRVAGTDDGTGNLDIQAARESRPHGTMDGSQGIATKDGVMIGADLLRQVHHLLLQSP